jgi:hypothetical protein
MTPYRFPWSNQPYCRWRHKAAFEDQFDDSELSTEARIEDDISVETKVGHLSLTGTSAFFCFFSFEFATMTRHRPSMRYKPSVQSIS